MKTHLDAAKKAIIGTTLSAVLCSFLVTHAFAQTEPVFGFFPGSDKLPLSGPKAWCSRPEVIKNILLGLNATTAVRDSGEKIYDFRNSTTTKFDIASKTAACHGVAQASNGQALPGTFLIDVNAAGGAVWRWANDDLPPQKQMPGQMTQMPDDELAFIEAVATGGQNYEKAITDFSKGASRPARAALVCSALKSNKVNNWIGKLVALTTNGEGKGVMTIELVPNLLYVKTWNNSISDIGADTMVEPGSRLFTSLGSLNISDSVRFSGEFLSSKIDCVRESSVTLQGSMAGPEYLMRFSTVEKFGH